MTCWSPHSCLSAKRTGVLGFYSNTRFSILWTKPSKVNPTIIVDSWLWVCMVFAFSKVPYKCELSQEGRKSLCFAVQNFNECSFQMQVPQGTQRVLTSDLPWNSFAHDPPTYHGPKVLSAFLYISIPNYQHFIECLLYVRSHTIHNLI